MKLVGRRHTEAVDRLSTVFDAEPLPRLVILRGAPGAGKTSIIQGFFEGLVEDYQGGSRGYWPAGLVDPDRPTIEQRHCLVPTEINPAEGTPTFGWIAMRGEADEGSVQRRSAAWLNQNRQIAIAPIATHRAVWRRTNMALKLTLAPLGVVVGVVSLFTSNVLLTVMSVALLIYSLPDVVKAVLSGLDDRRSSREQAELLNQPAIATGGYSDRDVSAGVKSFRQLLNSYRTANLTTVVVFDDAHHLDELACAILDSILASRDARVLAVAALPSVRDSSQWFGLGDVLERFPSKVEYLDIEPLTREELTELVQTRWESADEEVTQLIVDWAAGHSNPMVVTALLELPIVRRMEKFGSKDLSADNIRALVSRIPAQARDVLSEYWWELPDEVKQALGVASFFGDVEIVPSAVEDALAACLNLRDEGSVAAARDIWGWLETVSDFLNRFRDPVLRVIAQDHVSDVLADSEVRSAKESLLGFARGQINGPTWSELPAPHQRVLLKLYLVLVADLHPPTSGDVDIALSLARLADSPLDLRERAFAAGVAARWAGQLDQVHSQAGAPVMLANAELDLGRPEVALEALSQIADESVPGGLRAEWTVARATAQRAAGTADQITQANLMEVLTRSENAEVTRGVRIELARLYKYAGNPVAAIRELETVRDEVGVEQLSNDPAARGALTSLAGSQLDAGRPLSAETTIGKILAALEMRDDPAGSVDAILLQGYLAAAERQTRRVDDSIERARELVAVCDQRFGPDHPDSLCARNTLGLSVLAAPDESAVALYRSLTADQDRVSGKLHPMSLRYRAHYCEALRVHGRSRDGVAVLDGLCQQALQKYGTTNLEVVRAGCYLAYARVDTDPHEWRAALERVWAEAESLLGEAHPVSLRAARFYLRHYSSAMDEVTRSSTVERLILLHQTIAEDLRANDELREIVRQLSS